MRRPPAADAAPQPAAATETSAAAIGMGSEQPVRDRLAAWRGAVWRHLAARPPKAARGAGVAIVAFVLGDDGGLSDLRIARSSGRAAFDRACLAAVRTAAPFPVPPREAGPNDQVFEISIRAPGLGAGTMDGVYANAD